jgi:hypothetical protein
MTTLLAASGNAGTIILVNLSMTLLVDLHYLKIWLGQEVFDSSVTLVTCKDDVESATTQESQGSLRIFAVQAENYNILDVIPYDLVLNIVSMGEMDPEVVMGYFSVIRSMANKKKLYFYCCNRIEKLLPDGTITRFLDYPWSDKDQVEIDERCPWHQEYYSARFPFYHKYDGPVQHRLALMAGSTQI